MESQIPHGPPSWSEDVWERWFYSFMKDIAQTEDLGSTREVLASEKKSMGEDP